MIDRGRRARLHGSQERASAILSWLDGLDDTAVLAAVGWASNPACAPVPQVNRRCRWYQAGRVAMALERIRVVQNCNRALTLASRAFTSRPSYQHWGTTKGKLVFWSSVNAALAAAFEVGLGTDDIAALRLPLEQLRTVTDAVTVRPECADLILELAPTFSGPPADLVGVAAYADA